MDQLQERFRSFSKRRGSGRKNQGDTTETKLSRYKKIKIKLFGGKQPASTPHSQPSNTSANTTIPHIPSTLSTTLDSRFDADQIFDEVAANNTYHHASPKSVKAYSPLSISLPEQSQICWNASNKRCSDESIHSANPANAEDTPKCKAFKEAPSNFLCTRSDLTVIKGEDPSAIAAKSADETNRIVSTTSLVGDIQMQGDLIVSEGQPHVFCNQAKLPVINFEVSTNDGANSASESKRSGSMPVFFDNNQSPSDRVRQWRAAYERTPFAGLVEAAERWANAGNYLDDLASRHDSPMSSASLQGAVVHGVNAAAGQDIQHESESITPCESRSTQTADTERSVKMSALVRGCKLVKIVDKYGLSVEDVEVYLEKALTEQQGRNHALSDETEQSHERTRSVTDGSATSQLSGEMEATKDDGFRNPVNENIHNKAHSDGAENFSANEPNKTNNRRSSNVHGAAQQTKGYTTLSAVLDGNEKIRAVFTLNPEFAERLPIAIEEQRLLREAEKDFNQFEQKCRRELERMTKARVCLEDPDSAESDETRSRALFFLNKQEEWIDVESQKSLEEIKLVRAREEKCREQAVNMLNEFLVWCEQFKHSHSRSQLEAQQLAIGNGRVPQTEAAKNEPHQTNVQAAQVAIHLSAAQESEFEDSFDWSHYYFQNGTKERFLKRVKRPELIGGVNGWMESCPQNALANPHERLELPANPWDFKPWVAAEAEIWDSISRVNASPGPEIPLYALDPLYASRIPEWQAIANAQGAQAKADMLNLAVKNPSQWPSMLAAFRGMNEGSADKTVLNVNAGPGVIGEGKPGVIGNGRPGVIGDGRPKPSKR